MPSLFGFLNRLLPFATPGTPVVQDLIHLAVICVLLYFAPQIQERLQTARVASADTVADRALPYEHHLADPSPEGAAPVEEDGTDGDAAHGDAAPVEEAENVGDVRDDANNHFEGGQAGPAHEPILPPQRNVGAKKAKALARRDQRRAYHEFQRSQGEAQRAKDAEGAAEREKAQAAERERRRAAEATLEAKKARERQDRRARDEAQRAEEQHRREQTVELIRHRLEQHRVCDLFQVAREVGVDDEDWVEKLLRSSGVVGRLQNDAMTMITATGWAVRVSAADMQRVYDLVLAQRDGHEDEHGHIDTDHLGSLLEASLIEWSSVKA